MCGYSLAVNILSPSGCLHVHAAGLAGDGSRYGGNIIPKLPPRVAIDRDGVCGIRRPGDSLHQRSQAVRLRVGEGPQENRVDHAKDRRVRSDTQRQGDDNHSRKTSVFV